MSAMAWSGPRCWRGRVNEEGRGPLQLSRCHTMKYPPTVNLTLWTAYKSLKIKTLARSALIEVRSVENRSLKVEERSD